MKLKYIFLVAALAVPAQSIFSQETDADKYRRSSLYSLMINHTEQKFAKEIRKSFLNIPTPDKFNNHDLSVKVIDLATKLSKANSDNENEEITTFLQNNQIAGHMVAKWFDRDKFTGACDMELIKERGLYNASEFDKQLASHSKRGIALLQYAGKDLIGNTFVVVNDIRYIDKEKRAAVAGGIIKGLGAVASIATGTQMDGLTNLVGDVVESIKGFRVKINTFLYRLEWNNEILQNFYDNQYTDKGDEKKKENFEKGRGTYKLTYVGKVESSGSTTSCMGVKLDEPENMVRKACQRAIDENIVDLQTKYEEFRTRTPLLSTEPITAYIGKKEGVTKDSQFEVLERVEEADGNITYKRVGIIKPVQNMIWDNRYMAMEEGAIGANLGKTTFTKVSGGEFMRGMLIREMSK